MFLIFQAVFSWAAPLMDGIEAVMGGLGAWVTAHMSAGPLQSLLVDGVINGAGTVLVFLPQIIILFFFILVLEDSGYLPRAAYLLDRLMGWVGLSGRAFIPLLSSHACAIPGIMATRTIPNWRDRLTTIMIAPLMTCSARLPVYGLLIAAFIPRTEVGPFNMQGLVLFVLYAAGIVSSFIVAFVVKQFTGARRYSPLMLELPDFQWPDAANLLLGLWERVRIFMSRVGGIILALMIVLWFLAAYPAPPPDATGPAIQYSFAGRLGALLQQIFAPIGFNWQISIALVPGLAAREVAVGALGTVYAMSSTGDDLSTQLEPVIASGWSLATACSLLAWYVFAPQCLSTLAVVKRETNSWRYPMIMAGVPVRAGLPGVVRHLSRGRRVDVGSEDMLQQILVALIVIAAVTFSAWKLMPARRRLRVLLALDALGRATSTSGGLARALAQAAHRAGRRTRL